ncbi:MAG: hypothetical protein ACON4R_14240 [Akkermansiaceae bacterium]
MTSLLAMLLKFQLNMGIMMGLTFSMAMRGFEAPELEFELQKLEAEEQLQILPAEEAKPAPAKPKKEEKEEK